MKKRFLLSTLSLLLIVCSCSEKVQVDGATGGSYIEAVVNGTTFKSTTTNISFATTTSPTQITITGNGPNAGEYIVLVIKNYDKANPVGTYAIGTSATSAAYAAYHRPNSNADEIATSGVIEIKGVAVLGTYGNFNFATQNSNITSGTLSLLY
jgi:hypothetical protein